MPCMSQTFRVCEAIERVSLAFNTIWIFHIVLYFSFTGELHLLRTVINIDGCIPPTSCQASPDVDVALRLCVVQRVLPGLAFGKTRKKSGLCQSLWNKNKLNWSCCSHGLPRDKYQATWGLWADALVGSLLVHYQVPVFKNWPI